MTQDFQQTVTALWQLAELGAPRFASDGSISLNFDDVDLRLAPSPNEQELWVRTDVGPLSAALAADADRLQKILGLSFAFLATHDVLVSLDDDRLVVSGAYAFRAQDLHVLSDLLSDVVSAAQTLQRQMDHRDVLQQRRPTQTDSDTMMIFQP
ncbi:MAG: type III secretion system chaperone [Pseudomonadota bacterium]